MNIVIRLLHTVKCLKVRTFLPCFRLLVTYILIKRVHVKLLVKFIFIKHKLIIFYRICLKLPSQGKTVLIYDWNLQSFNNYSIMYYYTIMHYYSVMHYYAITHCYSIMHYYSFMHYNNIIHYWSIMYNYSIMHYCSIMHSL